MQIWNMKNAQKNVKDAQKTDVKGRACQNIQNLQMCVPEIARVWHVARE
jgi:hypothetical protein